MRKILDATVLGEKKSWQHLPYWPRLLSADLAASYLSISVSLFKRLVKEGKFPTPVHVSAGRIHWDKNAIDAAVDLLSGNASSGEWVV